MLKAEKNNVEDIFCLGNNAAYEKWRDQKLAEQPQDKSALFVEIENMATPTEAEIDAIQRHCATSNMAFIATGSDNISKNALETLGNALGLNNLDANLYSDKDAISSLQVGTGGRQAEYIPYTNKGLSWHTDGYYNPFDKSVLAWSLFCERDAASGGTNQLLDHELAYILLREADPDFIHALMQPGVMTIPANIENGVEIRGAQSSPVFSINATHQCLHMRFSARTRNINWHQDELTQNAVNKLNEILNNETAYHIEHRLQPGEGVISNNVLHNRTAFTDLDGGAGRLIYRARYFDRVRNTQ